MLVIGVEIYVFDTAGNYDFCTTFLQLQDNVDSCLVPGPTSIIAGDINTELNEGVAQVEVELSNTSTGSTLMDITGLTGEYSFNNPGVPNGNNYTITPEKDINHDEGVTTFDLVLISQHVLGITPLNSPYKIIAADANKDNFVTTFDIVELRKLILKIVSELPDNTSWRFVDKAYNFPNPNNPFSPPFPEVIDINNLTSDQLDNDFVGVKIGDVNLDADPTQLVVNNGGSQVAQSTAGLRSVEEQLVFAIDNAVLTAGELHTVDFKASDFNNILGYQYTLNFDAEAMEFVDFAAGNLKGLGEGNFSFTRINEGIITTSWNAKDVRVADNEVLFSLTFKAKKSSRIG